MSRALRWQVPFASVSGQKYRVDIYEEGYQGDPVVLTAGADPFNTEEDASEDYFAAIRAQTGKLQVCTKIEGSDTFLELEDIMPATNISSQVFLVSIAQDETETIEWQGFLSAEAYSQDYTSIPQLLDLPIISVLEAMKSVEISSYWFNQTSGEKIGDFITDLLDQIYEETGMQIAANYSQASNDICNKYLFVSQFFNYETNEASGELTYIYKNTSIYDIFEKICKFMGWCLREQGMELYFERVGSDELGMTTVDMSSLTWRGTDHKRDLRQGAKSVSVEAEVAEFETHLDMPKCPITGLSTKNYYNGVIAVPYWYYDKCTRTSVLNFISEDISKAFLARSMASATTHLSRGTHYTKTSASRMSST